MNDLNATVRDLRIISKAYFTRLNANGAGHVDNEYLHRQGTRFYVAAEAINDTITAHVDSTSLVVSI